MSIRDWDLGPVVSIALRFIASLSLPLSVPKYMWIEEFLFLTFASFYHLISYWIFMTNRKYASNSVRASAELFAVEASSH